MPDGNGIRMRLRYLLKLARRARENPWNGTQEASVSRDEARVLSDSYKLADGRCAGKRKVATNPPSGALESANVPP